MIKQDNLIETNLGPEPQSPKAGAELKAGPEQITCPSPHLKKEFHLCHTVLPNLKTDSELNEKQTFNRPNIGKKTDSWQQKLMFQKINIINHGIPHPPTPQRVIFLKLPL